MTMEILDKLAFEARVLGLLRQTDLGPAERKALSARIVQAAEIEVGRGHERQHSDLVRRLAQRATNLRRCYVEVAGAYERTIGGSR